MSLMVQSVGKNDIGTASRWAGNIHLKRNRSIQELRGMWGMVGKGRIYMYEIKSHVYILVIKNVLLLAHKGL